MEMFKQAVENQTTVTTNGMKAYVDTSSACVDLFYAIGASRGQNILPKFVAAYAQNPELAIRIALWARDVRGGAGERQVFRDILVHMEKNTPEIAKLIMHKIPELGRWDDLLVFEGALQSYAFALIFSALKEGNGLCAKWMPRQGEMAVKLRNAFGMSPKQWRKMLVTLSNTVETQMCAKDWDNINFSHVPSLASTRYRKAFNRNTPKYAEYIEALKNGKAKVNAGAVYPYDVLKGVNDIDANEREHIIQMWNALPNYVGDASILPMVDVSGSMGAIVSGKTTAMDVAVSLGLYLSEKNTNFWFNNMFLTFSGNPQMLHLKGNIVERCQQMVRSEWGTNTNIQRAMECIVRIARKENVPQSDMPKMLLILSDMQFDASHHWDESALEMTKRLFEHFGYTMPVIVFWNIADAGNVPAKAGTAGVAMVSGFSPAIVKSLLKADLESISPVGIMLSTVLVDRYSLE